MLGLLARLVGGDPNREARKLQPLLDKINALESDFERLSDEALAAKTIEFRRRLGVGDLELGGVRGPRRVESLDDVLPEAFAAVREASKRSIGLRHFDVQLLGGVVLHRGSIAEMKTGEGKTLVASLPLYLNALLGLGVHLVTPNDYLARVGGGWIGPVYARLGLTTAVIVPDFSGIYDPTYVDTIDHGDDRLMHWRPATRKEAYDADVMYGTNHEFAFDYLRDNSSTYDISQVVQRELHYAIVDEVDSILVDEARTPHI